MICSNFNMFKGVGSPFNKIGFARGYQFKLFLSPPPMTLLVTALTHFLKIRVHFSLDAMHTPGGQQEKL